MLFFQNVLISADVSKMASFGGEAIDGVRDEIEQLIIENDAVAAKFSSIKRHVLPQKREANLKRLRDFGVTAQMKVSLFRFRL